MTAKPAPRPGGEAFASPASVNQRRYEAIRAYLYEGAPLDEAAARFGYSRSALASLVRDWRAGKLTLFAEPRRPGRKSAPKKDAARARVIKLPRHPRHPRGVVAAEPAGAQAHRHPAGQPRRRPARRPGRRAVRRARGPAEEVRADQLLLPADA